jgi:hypothetical protein
MSSTFRDPKTLPEWIELDYHRRRRGLWRWRWRLTWGALLGCAAAVAATAFSRRAQSFYQAGPVAPAHTMFACADCHTTPLQTARRFLPWDAAVRAVPNDACKKCHDGPVHNDKQLDADKEKACASCHHEHRGRAALARVPDRECTACHRDIKNHTAGGKSSLDNVTDFPTGHPEHTRRHAPSSAAVALNFPHDKHLDPKGVLMPDKNRKVLTCDSCHQPDAAGRFMRPVNYEKTCKDCHPLSVQLAGEIKDAALQKAADAFAKDPAPHLPPPEVRAVLRDRLLGLVRKFAPVPGEAVDEYPDRLGPHRLSPARQPWQPSGQERARAERLVFVLDQMPHVETLLFKRSGGCVHCHGEPTPGPDGLPDYPRKAVVAPPAPTDGRFDHQAHRLLACTECHPARGSKKLGDPVQMPRVETCARCHNPGAGARSDCVECHKYHPNKGSHKDLSIDQALGK